MIKINFTTKGENYSFDKNKLFEIVFFCDKNIGMGFKYAITSPKKLYTRITSEFTFKKYNGYSNKRTFGGYRLRFSDLRLIKYFKTICNVDSNRVFITT